MPNLGFNKRTFFSMCNAGLIAMFLLGCGTTSAAGQKGASKAAAQAKAAANGVKIELCNPEQIKALEEWNKTDGGKITEVPTFKAEMDSVKEDFKKDDDKKDLRFGIYSVAIDVDRIVLFKDVERVGYQVIAETPIKEFLLSEGIKTAKAAKGKVYKGISLEELQKTSAAVTKFAPKLRGLLARAKETAAAKAGAVAGAAAGAVSSALSS